MKAVTVRTSPGNNDALERVHALAQSSGMSPTRVMVELVLAAPLQHWYTRDGRKVTDPGGKK